MIGQMISGYRIVEKLGGGGMGVVYRDPLFAKIRNTPEFAAARTLAIEKQRPLLAHPFS